RSLKLSILAGLMVLMVFVVPSVSAFEISGMYTEEGQKWLNEHWGEKITLGELAKIAYAPEDYEKVKENVDSKLLEHIWSKPYTWGDRYPPEVITPGPKIFDENDQLVEDPDGSILAGILSGEIKSLRSGLIVTADPAGYSGGYITYRGSGKVYSAAHVDSLIVESQIYGDGNWLQTAYNAKYDYDNPSPYVTVTASGIRSPVHGTLYQPKTYAVSTGPDHSASTWGSSYFYS
ncbi:MAG: hypothetical protein M0Q92_12755, partial [Methanoregula sp.]|nr:hypothetical protein [Methanoregula sp.]